MRLLVAVLCCCLWWRTASAAGADAESLEHPLLDLARELEAERAADPGKHAGPQSPSDLRSARHALDQAQPPTDENCARSLGASVFADLYSELGQAERDRGDFTAAARSYTSALACTPRALSVLAQLADVRFKARDIAGAREIVRQSLAVNPRSVMMSGMAGDIALVEERWADAVAHFRYAASSEPDRMRAGYWQLRYWLAQWRSGVAHPEFVARRQPDDWPKELLLYMQDQYTEGELVGAVREGSAEFANVGRDERLCEALYYVGEAHWARGSPELARDYFAAAVNVRMIRFDEHGLALAEIAKLAKRLP